MSSNKADDDRAARKARADAIRRLRDTRNASLDKPAPEAPPAETPSENDRTGSPPGDDSREPNYVDFIDKKMRERQKTGRKTD